MSASAATDSRCTSWTPARASQLNIYLTCSSGSTASTPRAIAATAGRASDWPSRRPWWKHIAATSAGVGAGAQFTIVLPLAEPRGDGTGKGCHRRGQHPGDHEAPPATPRHLIAARTHSESSIPFIVAISCCCVDTIDCAIVTAAGNCPLSISCCAITIAPS